MQGAARAPSARSSSTKCAGRWRWDASGGHTNRLRKAVLHCVSELQLLSLSLRMNGCRRDRLITFVRWTSPQHGAIKSPNCRNRKNASAMGAAVGAARQKFAVMLHRRRHLALVWWKRDVLQGAQVGGVGGEFLQHGCQNIRRLHASLRLRIRKRARAAGDTFEALAQSVCCNTQSLTHSRRSFPHKKTNGLGLVLLHPRNSSRTASVVPRADPAELCEGVSGREQSPTYGGCRVGDLCVGEFVDSSRLRCRAPVEELRLLPSAQQWFWVLQFLNCSSQYSTARMSVPASCTARLTRRVRQVVDSSVAMLLLYATAEASGVTLPSEVSFQRTLLQQSLHLLSEHTADRGYCCFCIFVGVSAWPGCRGPCKASFSFA